MDSNQEYVIHWVRRDLRLHDNKALHYALESGYPVKCVFIFDKKILHDLPNQDSRVTFIHQQLTFIKNSLQKNGSDLEVFHGSPREVWQSISKDPDLKGVFLNRDYEPYATGRDEKVKELLDKKGIDFHTFKDHVVFEKSEILTQQETPYKVYTPYNRAWKEKLDADLDNLDDNEHLRWYEVSLKDRVMKIKKLDQMPALKSLGFLPTETPPLPTDLKNISVGDYDQVRDIPALEGTSMLGTALRFGTVSIRQTIKMAIRSNETFWDELIWREFFMQILHHFPYVTDKPFRKKYEGINWRNNETEFARWCEGRTGYPLVDAGMRELNATGFMHNRVRMVTASFLVKHLLIDWRWGEAYFAEKLMDYELASNNGNWQWAAGCGTDADPYFRIFNPISQQKKFDPEFKYIKRWVKVWETDDYPDPIVDHKEARERCLKAYKAVV